MTTDLRSAQRAGIADTPRTARRLVLVSGLFLAVQVSATDYGTDQGDSTEPAVFWFLVGATLLWFVYKRRSSTARYVILVLTVIGSVLYATNAFDLGRATVLTVAYAGQAIPLLLPAVRRHVVPS